MCNQVKSCSIHGRSNLSHGKERARTLVRGGCGLSSNGSSLLLLLFLLLLLLVVVLLLVLLLLLLLLLSIFYSKAKRGP